MKGFRARQTIRLGKLFRINLSKSGPSLSIGTPGATINIRNNKTRATVGAPGTGISYSRTLTTQRREPTFDSADTEAQMDAPIDRRARRRRAADLPTQMNKRIDRPPKRWFWRFIIRPFLWLVLLGFIVTYLYR